MKHLKPMEDELKVLLTEVMIAAVVRIPNGLELIRSVLENVEAVHAEITDEVPTPGRVIPLRPFFLCNPNDEP